MHCGILWLCLGITEGRKMLYRDVVELVAVTTVEDKDGYDQVSETKTEVFADVQSVKREEFYKSMQAGRELVAAFVIRACDYGGQPYLDYCGERYRVVRAYTKDGELLELNCAEHKGDRP